MLGSVFSASRIWRASWMSLRERPISAVVAVKQRRTRDQDWLRRVDHPLCCDASAPRLEARSAA